MKTEAFQGQVIEVKQVPHDEGPVRVVIIEEQGGNKGWYPLSDTDNRFLGGASVIVTPKTKEYPSGGSVTTYDIDLSLR